MSDLNLLELGRILIRSFYSGPTLGLSACTSESAAQACAATGYIPEADEPYANVETAQIGDPVTFSLPNALTCYGETSGLLVTLSIDDIVTNRQMTLNADGSYSITLEAFDWHGPAVFTVRDVHHMTEITLELADLPEIVEPTDTDTDPVDTDTDPDTDPISECELDPDPVVSQTAALIVEPGTEIETGQIVTLVLPLADVEECDGTNDNISAYVRVNGGDPVNAQLFDQEFVYQRPFNSAGEYSIVMYVRDDSRPEASTIEIDEVTITVSEAEDIPDEVCIDQPSAGEVSVSPDISEIINGSNTLFTWTQLDLVDCFGEDVILLSDNRDELLFDPAVTYAGGTLEISGQILPAVTSGTLSFNVEDNYGIPMTVNIPLPTILPLEVTAETSPIQESVEAIFSAPEVPGALNYRFFVTLPGEIDDLESNQLEPVYYYTPSITGDHILNVEITAYDSSIIAIAYPFSVEAAPMVIEPSSPDHEVGVETTFTGPTVSDALNYRFWVTLPGEIDDLESNQLEPVYHYTPSEPGEHILNLEITHADYSTILLDLPFTVSDGSSSG